MSSRKPSKKSLKRFRRRFRRNTGYSFDGVMKAGAYLVIPVVVIALTVLYTNAEQADKPSGIEGIASNQLTSEEQFLEVTALPSNFKKKKPVEKIGILKSKILSAEKLARSGGYYGEKSTDQLVKLYGSLCHLQKRVGIDASKAYAKLAELRQHALAAGDQERVAAADFFHVLLATESLNRYTEPVDFRFAIETISVLDSKNMINPKPYRRLFNRVIALHDNSAKQDSTATILSALGDKLTASPVSEISSLGLTLKDHAQYAPYYVAVDELPYTTRETKLQFFRDMFAEIEKTPPRSLETYKVVFQLIERLANQSDALFATALTKRLREALPTIAPAVRTKVEQSVTNAEIRISSLGETPALEGSTFEGLPLRLPNAKPTTLVFWRNGDMKSMEHLKSITTSSRFNPWGTNVLFLSLIHI